MSGPSLELEVRMRGNSVQAGLDSLAGKEQKVEDGLSKISRGAKSADRELERFAKQTERINASPLEKYTRQLDRLQEAQRKGLISQETYTAAVKRANSSYQSVGGPVQKLGGMIAGAAAQYATFGTAISIVNAALTAQVEKTKEAQRSLVEMLNMRIEMGQVGADKGQIDALTKHGLTRQEAGNLILQGQNLGFSKLVPEIAKNKAGLGNLGPIAQMAGDIPPLVENAITPRQAINMGVAAAGPSKLSPSQMAPIIAKAMAGALPTAEAADEAFAIASLLASKYASPDQAATQIGNFGIKAGLNEKLKGRSMADQARMLAAMPADERREFLKEDKETNEFYNKMARTLDELPARQEIVRKARLATGTPNEPMAEATRRNLQDPNVAAALEQIASEQNLLAEKEKRYGAGGAKATSAKNQFLSQLEKKRVMPMSTWAAEQAMWLTELFGIKNPKAVMAAGTLGAIGGAPPGLGLPQIHKILGAQGEASKALDQLNRELAEAIREQTTVLEEIRDNVIYRGSAGAAAAQPLN